MSMYVANIVMINMWFILWLILDHIAGIVIVLSVQKSTDNKTFYNHNKNRIIKILNALVSAALQGFNN